MTDKKREEREKHGPSQWEEMKKKGPKRGPYKGHNGLSSK
jgi:hypothetical protein